MKLNCAVMSRLVNDINCGYYMRPGSLVPKDVEILFQERLTWAGAQNGIAHEQSTLPISVWEEGCAWRRSGLQSLQDSQLDFRIAFISAHISRQRAAILADLAIAPRLVTTKTPLCPTQR